MIRSCFIYQRILPSKYERQRGNERDVYHDKCVEDAGREVGAGHGLNGLEASWLAEKER
jgi:hypothetical protein